MAVTDSWREVKKAELVENTNSRSRFLLHLVWRGHGKELPWGLGQWGGGQLATCVKKEGVLIDIYSYVSYISKIKYLSAHPGELHLERWRGRRRQRGRLQSWEELPACLTGFPMEGRRHQAFDLCLTQLHHLQDKCCKLGRANL